MEMEDKMPHAETWFCCMNPWNNIFKAAVERDLMGTGQAGKWASLLKPKECKLTVKDCPC